MTTLLRWTSALLFVSAVAAMMTLLFADVANALRLTPLHRQAGAISLMLIGLSYVSLQLSLRLSRAEKLRGVLLGGAFLLWGSGQFLPSGSWATALDTVVVVIFVTDLSSVIIDNLKAGKHEKSGS